MTSDGLGESFVSLREPFIDMNGSYLLVLCQPEMILFRFFRIKRGHVSLRGLASPQRALCYPDIALCRPDIDLGRLDKYRAGLSEPSVSLRGSCVSLGASGVGLTGSFVGHRAPCLT